MGPFIVFVVEANVWNVVGDRGAGGKREREIDEWSEDQRRWDAKDEGYKTEALTCRFPDMFRGDCRQGLNCPYWHSQEEIKIFVDELLYTWTITVS